MMGYRLPPVDDPLFEVEEADLEILRLFYSALLVSSPSPPADPVSAVRAHLPDFPAFPTFGKPSGALIVLKVARPSGPTVDLQNRLLEGMSAEQSALMLTLSGSA